MGRRTMIDRATVYCEGDGRWAFYVGAARAPQMWCGPFASAPEAVAAARPWAGDVVVASGSAVIAFTPRRAA